MAAVATEQSAEEDLRSQYRVAWVQDVVVAQVAAQLDRQEEVFVVERQHEIR